MFLFDRILKNKLKFTWTHLLTQHETWILCHSETQILTISPYDLYYSTNSLAENKHIENVYMHIDWKLGSKHSDWKQSQVFWLVLPGDLCFFYLKKNVKHCIAKIRCKSEKCCVPDDLLAWRSGGKWLARWKIQQLCKKKTYWRSSLGRVVANIVEVRN